MSTDLKGAKLTALYSGPLVSSGELVLGPPQIQKSADSQVPYVKWHSICILPMQIPPHTLNHL